MSQHQSGANHAWDRAAAVELYLSGLSIKAAARRCDVSPTRLGLYLLQVGIPRRELVPQSTQPCAAQGCGRPAYCRGFCRSHYGRFRHKGDALAEIPIAVPRTAEERFWSYVYPEPNSGCLLFAGGGKNESHGRFDVDRRPVLAHHYAWFLAGREIPPGKLLLHKCDVGCCVNVDHLYVGTNAQNARDMVLRQRGCKGRYPYGVARRGNRFAAQIRFAGKQRHLGLFATIEEAHARACEERERLWRAIP